jgi:eIF3 subunit 6 N terminal domain
VAPALIMGGSVVASTRTLEHKQPASSFGRHRALKFCASRREAPQRRLVCPGMAQHDLFPTFAKFLDPQLAFALLEYAAVRDIYDQRDVTEARIQLLHGTNMVEYEMSLYQELHNTDQPSQALLDRRAAVIEKLTAVQEKAKPMMEVLSKDEVVSQLKADRTQNMAFLKVRPGPQRALGGVIKAISLGVGLRAGSIGAANGRLVAMH